MNLSAMSVPDPDITEDGFLGGRLRLKQLRTGHRSGHDAILLAAATAAKAGDRVVEFGAGVGAAGLALASRVAGLDLVLLEINPVLADLARQNAALNNIPARVCVTDIAAAAADLAANDMGADTADVVLMNPPFNAFMRHQSSPDPARRLAHEAIDTLLETWVHAARRMLRPSGALTLIWRAEGLPAVLAALSRGFGAVVVLPVHSQPDRGAIRVIVRAVKGARGAMTLHPAIVLNDRALSEAVLRQGNGLSLGQS